MINRSAIVLRYKEPAVKWVNEADPFHDDPGITLADMNDEPPIYLISDHDTDPPENVTRWIKLNYEALFEDQLEGWYTDESLWPKKRNYSLFNEWFNIEWHSIILDTVGTPIIDDET